MRPRVFSLSLDLVRELCPECAERMSAQNLKLLKVSVDSEGAVRLGDGTALPSRTYAGFSQGLCKRFGADEGFFTRCAEGVSGKVDDSKAFCASLHKFCVGKWPAENSLIDEEDERLVALEHSNVIRGVEIFAAGTHNGDEYTEKDLDDMVAAFKELDYRPALKVGHTKDKAGDPAYGWVTNLKRVGQKLYADFEAMHDSVVDAIRRKLYDRVSSEVYFNFKRGEKTFRRALKAVALLGTEVPAVANLVPLHKMEFARFDALEKTAAFEAKLEVEQQAILDSLAQRVEDMTQLMKEYDMSKNAAKINSLKTQVEEFKKKLDEMKKGGKKTEDEEYKQLQAQADRIEAEIKTLTEQDDKDRENEDLRKKVAALEADKRAREVKERCAALKIPAFRPAIASLYGYALEQPETKVKVHSLPDKEGKISTSEKTLVEVADALVAEINSQADRLFKVHAAAGQPVRPEGDALDDPGAEVDRLTTELQRKQPQVYKTYDAALDAVLAEHTDLAAKYREQQNTGSRRTH